MNIGSVTQIKRRLAALNPVLLVCTHEEHRAIDALVQIAEKSKQNYTKVVVWTAFVGTTTVWDKNVVDKKKLTTVADVTGSPVAPLDALKDSNSTSVYAHTMLILKDYTHFLNGGAGVQVGRRLKDLAQHIQYNLADGDFRCVILLDSESEIPARMEKVISIIDFDLPTRAEIASEFGDRIKQQFLGKTEEQYAQDIDTLAQSTVGLTMSEVESALSMSVAVKGCVDPQMLMSEKKVIVRKSGVLEYYEGGADLDQVGGLDNLKNWLSVRHNAFSKEAAAFGLPSPKALLLVGIPGTGKSLIAKTIGAAWGVPVLRLDVGALFNSFVGASEANLRKALKTAETVSPCVCFIDEAEKSFGRGGNDGGTSQRLLATFLTWLSDKTAPVFVVFTANDITQLPPELLRAGRVDAIFSVDLPSHNERADISRIMSKKFKRESLDIMHNTLADMTPGFSGAEIEGVYVGALHEAFHTGTELSTELLLEQASRVVPLSSTMKEEIVALQAWAKGKTIPASTAELVQVETRARLRDRIGKIKAEEN